MRYAIAANRQIGVDILDHLLKEGYKPLALVVSERNEDVHSQRLKDLSKLPAELIFNHKNFKTELTRQVLANLQLDYIFGIHFPHIVPPELLEIPKIGFLNLHPSFLPYNKGWHTPSWTILEETPCGATLHFMSEKLDVGDIIRQARIEVRPNDTADSLYTRILDLELRVFKESLPELASLKPKRISQTSTGTSHSKKDLGDVQELRLSDKATFREMLDRLRALTTDRISEAAYFKEDGKKYAVTVQIEEIDNQ